MERSEQQQGSMSPSLLEQQQAHSLNLFHDQIECFQTLSQHQSLTLIHPPPAKILFLLPSLSTDRLTLHLNKQKQRGKGTFNVVYPGFLLTSTNTWLPLVIKESKLTKAQHESCYRTSYTGEVQALALLSHCPWTVKMIAAFYNSEQKLCIALQQCKSSLQAEMKAVSGNHELILQIFHQMIEYLIFSHNLKKYAENKATKSLGSMAERIEKLEQQVETVIHKDIKPANILIREYREGRITIAVADFGISTLSRSSSETFTSLYGGTLRFSSPQIQQKLAYDSRTDCWSFAMMMRTLLLKPLQLETFSPLERISLMESLGVRMPSDLSSSSIPHKKVLVYILQNCLQGNPQQRIFSRQIKQIWDNYHSFLNSHTPQNLPEFKAQSRIVFRLITIQIILIEESIKPQSRIERTCLLKIVQNCKHLILQLLQEHPIIISHLQLKTLTPILGVEVAEDWQRQIQRLGYDDFYRDKVSKEKKSGQQNTILINFCKVVIDHSSFSAKIKGCIEQFSQIANQISS